MPMGSSVTDGLGLVTYYGLRITSYTLLVLIAVASPSTAYSERRAALGPAASNPRSDFATGWHEGVGAGGSFQWTYWRSIDASVSLSIFDHSPKANDEPEVLLGVWTLGVHWRPGVTWWLRPDLMLGAQSHTAVFHKGFDKYEGVKGFDETDLGFCFGLGLETPLTETWLLGLHLRTNTIFTQPEWVRYETIGFGLVHVLSQ